MKNRKMDRKVSMTPGGKFPPTSMETNADALHYFNV